MKKLSIALLFASIHMSQAYVLNDFTNAVQAAKANKSDANVRKVLEILDDLTKKRNISSAQVQRLQELGLGEYANVSNRLETYNLRRGTASQAEQLAGRDAQLAAQQQELLNKKLDALRLKTEVEQLRGDFLGAVGNLRRLKNEVAETLEQNTLLSQAEFAQFQKDKKAEIDQLKADLQDAKNAADLLSQNPNLDDAAKAEITKLRAQIQNRVDENLKQSDKITELIAAVKALQTEKAAGLKDLQDAQASVSSIERDLTTLKTDYSKAVNQIAALERQAQESDDKSGLVALKQQFDAEKATYEQTLTSLKASLENANKELNAARSGAELQSATSKIILLEMQLNALKNQISDLQDNLNQAKQFKTVDAAKDVIAERIKEFKARANDVPALRNELSQLSKTLNYIEDTAARVLRKQQERATELNQLLSEVPTLTSEFAQIAKIDEFDQVLAKLKEQNEYLRTLDANARAALTSKIDKLEMLKNRLSGLRFKDNGLQAKRTTILKNIDEALNLLATLPKEEIINKDAYEKLLKSIDVIEQNINALGWYADVEDLDSASEFFKKIDEFVSGSWIKGWITSTPKYEANVQNQIAELKKQKDALAAKFESLRTYMNKEKGKEKPGYADIQTYFETYADEFINLIKTYEDLIERAANAVVKQQSSAPLALPAPEIKPDVKPGNGGAKSPQDKLLDQYRSEIVDAASAALAIDRLSERDLEAEGEDDLVKNTLKKQIAAEANAIRQVLAEREKAGNKIELNAVSAQALSGL